MNSTKDDKPLEDGLKITNEKDEDLEKDVGRKSPPFVPKPGKKNGSPEFSIDSLIHRKTKDYADGKQRLYFIHQIAADTFGIWHFSKCHCFYIVLGKENKTAIEDISWRKKADSPSSTPRVNNQEPDVSQLI